MQDKFYILDDLEVISVDQASQIKIQNATCTTREFTLAVMQVVYELARYNNSSIGWNEKKSDWFGDPGLEGEVLQFGEREWKKGRLKLAVAFCPDEPEPDESEELPILEASIETDEAPEQPLDEIRKLAED